MTRCAGAGRGATLEDQEIRSVVMADTNPGSGNRDRRAMVLLLL
jgi:hypothetical protein